MGSPAENWDKVQALRKQNRKWEEPSKYSVTVPIRSGDHTTEQRTAVIQKHAQEIQKKVDAPTRKTTQQTSSRSVVSRFGEIATGSEFMTKIRPAEAISQTRPKNK